MIPDGWEIKPLQDCCVGKPQYGANAAAVAYSELLPRYIRITDIDENGKLIDDTKVSIGLEGNEKYILRPNDFLFARSGATVGKTYLYFEADGLAIYAGYLIKFRIDSNILLPEHLKHYTQTTKYWRWVQNTIHAGAQPNINAPEYSTLPIPLPPLPEQRKIADILGAWDEAIALTEQLIEAKQRRKKALAQQLLTGRRRFKEFEGQPWRKARLEELLDIQYGKSPKDIRNDDGPFLIYGTGGIVGRTDQTLCEQPAVIIGRKGTINQPRLAQKPFWAIDTTFFGVPKDNVDACWIYHVLGEINLEQYNEASGVPSLSRSTLYNISIHVPEFKEQQKIAEVLQVCDAEIDLLHQKLDVLRRQKKGLMQQLLTGRVRVKAV